MAVNKFFILRIVAIFSIVGIFLFWSFSDRRLLLLDLSNIDIHLSDPYKLDSIKKHRIEETDRYFYFTVTENDKIQLLKFLKTQTSFDTVKGDTTQDFWGVSENNKYGKISRRTYYYRYDHQKDGDPHGEYYFFNIDTVSNKCELIYFEH